jgi:membrane AbrB-like protein
VSGEPVPAALAARSSSRYGLRFAFALLVGASGGAVFFVVGLPLPWMLGAMAAATVAALARAPLAVSPGVRSGTVAVLGVLLGSQFSLEIFAHVAQWYVGLSGVVVSVIVMTTLSTVYFVRIGRYDRTTAYFSSMPGGLSEMMVLGEAMGGDGRRISLTHAVRVLTAVFLIAFYFRLFEGYAPTRSPTAPVSVMDWPGILILMTCAVAGYYGARTLRIPAAQLVGPLCLSALVYLTGVVDTKPPAEILAAAQVVLGTAIGARFTGTPLALVWRTILVAAGAAVIMVLVAAGFAVGLGWVSGTPSTALFLALAPGGLAEMSIIALSLGSVAAFVSTHHVARIILIVILSPIFFRTVLDLRRNDNKPESPKQARARCTTSLDRLRR